MGRVHAAVIIESQRGGNEVSETRSDLVECITIPIIASVKRRE